MASGTKVPNHLIWGMDEGSDGSADGPLTVYCDGLRVLQDGIPSWDLHCDGVHPFGSKLEWYASLQGDQGLKQMRPQGEGTAVQLQMR